jgi:LysM repeat protein
MPNVPRVALGALALIVAAALLLILPGLFLNKGGSPAADASPTASPSPSVSLAPTPTPAATPLTYTVVANDTLTKIANKFKTTQKAILAANPSLKNANLIAVGQVLVIPTPPPPDVIHSSTAPSPSAATSAAP